jgi:serine protease Do
MDKPHGALVSKVVPDGPAAKAGIQAGDVVLEFGGKTIDTSSDLPPLVGSTRIGETVPLKVMRNGRIESLQVAVAELPKDDELAPMLGQRDDAPIGSTDSQLKVTVSDLTKQQRDELEVDDRGVIVTKVEEGPAYKAGIREGDVIMMVDNQKVENARQFKELVGKLPAGKSVPVLIQRRGGPVFLALRLPGVEKG